MFGRSRSVSVCVLILSCILFTGCARSTKPRTKWWQFWRPKATASQPVYHPDTEILPPPPGVLDAQGGGTGTTLAPGELPPPPTMEQASQMPEPGAIRRPAQMSDLHMIYFDFDSSDLSAEAMELLNQNAAWLKSRGSYEVSIEGHCDERGTAEYNMNLGMRRAKTVRDYLITQGIDGTKLHTTSYGEERPLDPSGSEQAFAKNRRVQFLIY